MDYAHSMQADAACSTCGSSLTGRQRRFCSLRCKNVDTNNRHQVYANQQQRGLVRKLAFMEAAGGRCMKCGYDTNLAALTWHHLDPATKSFSLDLRSLSNRSLTRIRRELAKCIVLCCNCHAETHFPGLEMREVRAGRAFTPIEEAES
jgi:hypothetical protein